MPRYYQSALANRPLTIGGHTFNFTVSQRVAGNAYGILALDDPGQIEAMQQAVYRRLGVSEITEAEWIRQGKTHGGSPRLPTPKPPQPSVLSQPFSMQTKQGAVLAEAPAIKPPEPSLPEPDKVVQVGRVNSPDPFAETR